MRHILIPSLISTVITILIFTSANASEDHMGEEKIAHYEFDQPTTKAEALQLYHEHMGIIGYIISRQPLNQMTLEAIHEYSYALEAAVDSFETLNVVDATSAKELAHLVHELHEYSEDYKPKKTRDYFAKLRTSASVMLQ